MTEKEFYKTVINGLKNRGFSWDIFLRPFRIMYYKYKLRKLNQSEVEN